MKVVIVSDHYPLSPRIKKMRNSIMKLTNISEVIIFAWNRNSTPVEENYVTTYDQAIGYGNFYKSALNVKKFLKNAKLFITKKKPDIVHIIDFSLLPLTKMHSKKIKIIYEVYDIKFYSNKFYNFIRENLEKKYLKNTDSIIVASPFFIDYYQKKLKYQKEIVCINNKPNYESTNLKVDPLLSSKELEVLNKNIVISFIGNIRYRDILINLVDAVLELKDDVYLMLAGDGQDLPFFKSYILESNEKNRVIFTGRFAAENLKELYDVTDIVWAAYPNKDKNVQLAISNKFFESRIFAKPVVVSKSTKLAKIVETNGWGISIDPYNKEDIKKELTKIVNDKLIYNHTARESLYWEDEEKQLREIYL